MSLHSPAVRTGKYVLPLAFFALMWTVALAREPAAPQHIEKEIGQARLAGQGSFRWFGLKIYDAALWVGDKGYRAQAPAAAKLVLDLRYARNLQGKKIAAASEDEMRKLGLGSAQQRASWQAAMENIFPDVNEGTHLSGVYLPNEGARFYLNGKFIGEIMDAEFSHAFFAIWLDPQTTAAQLRNALLADAAPH
ncbi:chalcone isomerase family protein [Herminiimonas fonticola]|uniref:chalcone isomerase family protein n=1 Tax=Herminiimonas fonticola TaxID=303380 RepID=UPI00333EC9FC